MTGTWIVKSGTVTSWSFMGWTEQIGINNPYLSSLVASVTSDGSINRGDMIQILRTAGNNDGVIDATELNDLKYILANASSFQLPGYVQVLTGNIVYGNVANAHYQGQTMGNLAAGSTASQMNNLIDKWFYGSDHPETSYAYRYFAGSLFVGGPAYNDSNQGYLGDCYFIASLDAIAKSSPSAIQNMFIDNGDNTWTIRYYYNGVADYVTVDRYLPSSYNYAIFADVRGLYTNSGNELWMALAEKAYAQWNETGKEGRDGTNSYASIEGGWMQTVCQQVLGTPSQVCWGFLESDKQKLINALAANQAVTCGTYTNAGNGLVGNHAYMISSYNSGTGKFQLYNPWGSYQPGPLTYAQLRTNVQCFVVASTSGSVPISAVYKSSLSTPLVASTQIALSDIEPLAVISEDIDVNKTERAAAIDRLMITRLSIDGNEYDWIQHASDSSSKNQKNDYTLIADLIFAWQDAFHLACI
jgi:hypothetical protein